VGGVIVDVFELEPILSPFLASKAMEEAQSLVGRPYDYGAVFGRYPLRLSGDDRARWFCSEIVAEVCERIGRPLFARTRPHQVSPDMIARSPLLRWVESMRV
jgi:hypothetical protein